MREPPPGLHGAHRRADLREQLGQKHVRALLAGGRLVPFARQVLVDRNRQLDLRTRAAASLLLVGHESMLTGHTAAVVHGCTAADADTVHVRVGYGRKLRRQPELMIHQGLIDEDEIVTVDGLRVHLLECAIAELLCWARRPTALAVADQAFALQPPEEREHYRAVIADRIEDRRDPRGQRRAEPLLALATGLAESPAESWLLLSFFQAGLSIPRLQLPVVDLSGRVRYRLDFAWEEARVAVEYDGYEAHELRAAQDAAREADLRRRGWTIIRATAEDLRNPRPLISAISLALYRRRSAA
jgi:hypothetical protein